MAGLLGGAALGQVALGGDAAATGNQTLNATVIQAPLTLQNATLETNSQELLATVIQSLLTIQNAVLTPGAVTLQATVIQATAVLNDALLRVSMSATVITATPVLNNATLVPGGTTIQATVIDITSVLPTAFMQQPQTITAEVINERIDVFSATLTAHEPLCDLTVGPITVGCILEHIFALCGIAPDEWDVSDAIDEVDGFTVAGRQEAREAVERLLRVFRTDLIEVDGIVEAIIRGSASVVTIDERELGWKLFEGDFDSEPEDLYEGQLLDTLEIPTAAEITYYSKTKDYEQAIERANRYTRPNQEILTVQTSLVMTSDFARQAIERMLYDLWVNREQFQIVLPPKYMYLAPGDVVEIPVKGDLARIRLISQQMSIFGPVQFSACLDDVGILTQVVSGATLRNTEEVSFVDETGIIAWSSNALRDADADSVGFYFAVFGQRTGDWPGCAVYWSRDGGTTYEVLESVADESEVGVAETVLAAGTTTGEFDTTNTVDVVMTNGAPVSASEIEVLNGANVGLLGDEVIQWVTATSLGAGVYRLSNLLRGRRGTNNFWADHVVGERFVILDNEGATIRVTLSEDLINKEILLKPVTEGTTLGDTAETSLTITGDELKPYDGTDLEGARDGGNNLTITWKRRTRKGGTWSDLIDADLSEETEAYEVDVYNGVSVVRTISTSTPSAAYSAADQTTDFGSPQAAIDVEVFQIGKLGRGYALEGTV